MKKLLVVGVIVLFLGVAFAPSTGIIVSNDDTTPPVTTIYFDPPEPDGDNGWYVSNVTVMFNATDDMSGVNVTYYRISYGAWYIYTEPFAFGAANFIIEYYSVDNAGNEEEVKSAGLYIDQKRPYVSIGINESGDDIFINATAEDQHFLSGMNRVEFYYKDDLQATVYGPGPVYRWKWNETNMTGYTTYGVRGLILNPPIIDQNITFFCIIVFISESIASPRHSYVIGYDNAGNWKRDNVTDITALKFVGFPKLKLFQQVTLPKYYDGFLGKYFVNAWFRPWD